MEIEKVMMKNEAYLHVLKANNLIKWMRHLFTYAKDEIKQLEAKVEINNKSFVY